VEVVSKRRELVGGMSWGVGRKSEPTLDKIFFTKKGSMKINNQLLEEKLTNN
tara:strand:+ start:2617 stop:2772 length:156 start_codon:yes stop_codon:yes gene_type:complete